jgi:hypothetical protein
MLSDEMIESCEWRVKVNTGEIYAIDNDSLMKPVLIGTMINEQVASTAAIHHNRIVRLRKSRQGSDK